MDKISFKTPDFTNTFETNFKKLDKSDIEKNPEISNLLENLFALEWVYLTIRNNKNTTSTLEHIIKMDLSF